ncbi:MAG TPA: rhodanese-like domain-containing protein [Cyclobacteriaceae bacterium]
MKTLLFLAISVFATALCAGQDKQYVCTPCGQDCDNTIHHKPGSCPACGMALVEKTTVKFKNLTFEEVCERLKANPKAVLLDVRTSEEFEGTSKKHSFGHFRNAININVEELSQRLNEIEKYKDEEVIVYCSHSHRSPRASQMLTSNGFKNVENVRGGVSAIRQSEKDCLSTNFVSHKD